MNNIIYFIINFMTKSGTLQGGTFSGTHTGNGSGLTNVDADLWSGNSYPGGTIWTSNNDGSGSGLDADKLDDKDSGNDSNEIPISNGTVCSNLNADKLDGHHASDFISNPYNGQLQANQFYANSNTEYGFKAGSSILQYGFWAQGCDDAGFFAANVDAFGFQAYNNDIDGVYSSDNTRYGYYGSGNGVGGYGGQSRDHGILLVSENDNIATASFHNTSHNAKGLFVEGSCHTTGCYTASIVNVNGVEHTASALLSTKQEIIAHGTSALTNGIASIQFAEDFSSIVSDKLPITITVTPREATNGLLFVQERNENGFTAKLMEIPGMKNGTNNVEFDWIAIGCVRGYEVKEDLTDFINIERLAKDNMVINKHRN